MAYLSLEQIAALSGLGRLPAENALVEDQIQRGMQLQQPGAYQYRTGLGAAMGGVGDVLRTGAGALSEWKGRQELKANQKRAADLRSQFLGQVMAGGSPQLPDSPAGGMVPGIGDLLSPSPEAKAKALAATLQGDRAAAMAALGSGDPLLGKWGEAMMGDVRQQQGRDFEQSQAEAQRTFAAGEAEKGREFTGRQNALTRNTENWTPFSTPTGQAYRLNRKTGETEQVGGAPGPGGAPVYDKRIPPLLQKLGEDLDPNGYRAGEMKRNQERINAAIRLEKLIKTGDGDIRDLDIREMPELAISLQNLLAAGHGSEAEVMRLIPDTARGNVTKLWEWFSNEPHGAGQQAFAQKMAHTVEREKQAAVEALQKAQVQRISRHIPLLQIAPGPAAEVIRGYGIDPASLPYFKNAPPAEGAAPGSGTTGNQGNQPPAGKIRVTNGKEALFIDPADLPEAEKDGFHR